MQTNNMTSHQLKLNIKKLINLIKICFCKQEDLNINVLQLFSIIISEFSLITEYSLMSAYVNSFVYLEYSNIMRVHLQNTFHRDPHKAIKLYYCHVFLLVRVYASQSLKHALEFRK